jgi:hypothetical protein
MKWEAVAETSRRRRGVAISGNGRPICLGILSQMAEHAGPDQEKEEALSTSKMELPES